MKKEMPDAEASSIGGGSNGGGSNAGGSSGGGGGGGGSGNNSSDFVRKLYKMLEEPQYANVVRWGNGGKSFVVLENEKFTKHILPKHFKHSNFASFVRQLNKYDFHKVRQSDENGQSQYGQSAWEFVHPEFRADRKDNLDNIRRKAPAPRRQQTTDDQFPRAQQVIETLAAQLQHSRQELQALQEETTNSTRLLADQVGRLRKMVTRHTQAVDELVTWHVQTITEQRANGQTTISMDELPRHLRQTREIVDSLFRDLSTDNEKLNPLYNKHPGTPDDNQQQPNGTGNSDVYSMLPYGMNGCDGRPHINPSNQGPQSAKKKDIWGDRKPCVLLVEDESIAARIAEKRLSKVCCSYHHAKDGEEAVGLVNNEPYRFDLILMDIRLPKLSGIQATACIRVENHPRMPIIAMTASRQPDDLTTYLKHGMDDLLPKPFTEQVFEAMLRKHLPHLLYRPRDEAAGELGNKRHISSVYQDRGAPALPLSAAPMVVNTSHHNLTKFEQTPIQSPSGTLSWGQSPATANTIQTASPVAPSSNGMVQSAGPSSSAAMHHNGIATAMPSGLPDGMGSMTNGMGGMGNGNPMSNCIMGHMDPSMTSLGGPSPYMAAIASGQMGVPSLTRGFPAMAAGYGQLADGGLDFGDERPEKRQRLYAPADMGYPS